MKVGASLNAKGWGMISEGLTMLETATAGADIPNFGHSWRPSLERWTMMMLA